MPANGDAEVGGGGGMKTNLAPAGTLSRFVRLKEWQNCAGAAVEEEEEEEEGVSLSARSVVVVTILCAGGGGV